MELTGNTILITGGASGIGLELAKQLHALGNTVLITGRDEAKLAAAKKAIPELATYQSDVARAEDIDALYATLEKDHPELNIIVNNAGVMRSINLHKDQPMVELTREIEINLMGPIRMVGKFLPWLKKQPRAAIVNVSSGLAFVPLPSAPVYCATKAALHSFTRSLRVQLKKTNVKVFEIAPPATHTELLTNSGPSEDLEGVAVMAADEMVRQSVRGMQRDRFEIRPGQSNQLRFMNRLAPEFILAQLSKPVERMLREE